MNLNPGMKVVVKDCEEGGFAEVVSYANSQDDVDLKFYSSPVDLKQVSIPATKVRYPILPNQTKCFFRRDGHIVYGRIIICRDESKFPRSYFVKIPNIKEFQELREDEFIVHSYVGELSPVNVLSELAQETPFFFQQRYDLLQHITKQYYLCGGITSLPSSRIEFFDHQVEIAKRILQDPKIRYLLADEVGLGKTIEAGIIARQVKMDHPGANVVAFVPKALVDQWNDELDNRFSLNDVSVFTHEEIIVNQRGIMTLL